MKTFICNSIYKLSGSALEIPLFYSSSYLLWFVSFTSHRSRKFSLVVLRKCLPLF